MAEADTPRSWSDLPLDLAGAVLRLLPPRHLDRVRFGAVCPQWRAAARENPALPSNFPWLLLPDRNFYSLPGSAFRPLPVHLDGHRQLPHAQSCCGQWLVFERRDSALTLMSPFSAATIVLPGLHTLNARHDKPFKVAYDVQGPAIWNLVVCSDKLVAAAVVVDGTNPAAVRLGLALCRPGATSWSWAIRPGLNGVLQVRDIVLYQGQLYTLSLGRSLSSLSVQDVAGEPVVSRVDQVIQSLWMCPQLRAPLPFYLLESDGKLLMINVQGEPGGGAATETTLTSTTKFMVYVAMFEHSQWGTPRNKRQLRKVVPDNVVLFLGPWCSRSVAIPKDPDQRSSYIDMGGSSIIFFSDDGDGVSAGYRRKSVPFYCGVYDIKTGRSQTLLRTLLRPLKGFPATWLFPPIQPSMDPAMRL